MPPYEKNQIFNKNTQKPRRHLKNRSSGKNPAVVTLCLILVCGQIHAQIISVLKF